MKRKILSIIMSFLLLMSSANVFASESVTVYLDNELIQFDIEPRIVNGRTMVPMRAIFEKLGATVNWDETTNTASAYNYNEHKGVTITIGEMYLTDYQNKKVNLDVAAFVENGRTLVPLRAISESFKCNVIWEEATSTVKIYSENFIDLSITDTMQQVEVATANELIENIGNNKKIILTSDYYNLSTVKDITNEHVEKQPKYDDTYYNAFIFKNIVNMTIEGNAKIVIDDINADVLSFKNCGNITLSGLTVGHTTYYDEYRCEGSVTEFDTCTGININKCNLFGCGAVGINTRNVTNLNVNDSKIYDCSFTGMYLDETTASVKNTEFCDSTHYGGFVTLHNTVIDFENCNVHDIKTASQNLFAFIEISDFYDITPTKSTFNNCNFYNNQYEVLTNEKSDKIIFNNCTFKHD